MIVVSNTSPITNLAAIGKLELLEQLIVTPLDRKFRLRFVDLF